jgi:hypothetical protein
MRNRDFEDSVDQDNSGFSHRQYTRDTLQTLSENEVRQAEKDLKREISSVRSRNKNTYELEIELCYVQDEINRRDAVSAHMNYKDS